MSDVGPWTRFGDNSGAAPVASEEPGPWTKYSGASKPGKDAGLYSRFLSGFTSDQQEQVRMLADRLFPNEDLDKSVQRFKYTDNKWVYRGDDGQVYDAMPQGGMRGALGDVLQGVGKTLPIGGGTAAGIATAPLATTGVGVAGTMAAAAGGAAAGEVARQKLGDYLLGRASTSDINVPQLVRESAESGLGQGAGVAFNALAARGAVRDISKFDPVTTRQNYDNAARFGVDITPAEATGLSTLAAQQKRLTNITATSDEMKDFLRARDQQVFNAWSGFLDDISGAADAEDVGRLARGTAQTVLKGMREKLQKEAAPFYKKAYEDGDREIWSDKLAQLAGSPSIKAAMQKAVTEWQDDAIADGFGAMNPGALVENGLVKFNKSTGIPAFPNLQFWDYTKRALDKQIEAAVNNGERSEVRKLTRLVQQLRGELDQIGPAEYKQARQIYSTGSEEVTNALQSALNIIAETKDTSILQAARHAFDPTTRSPQMVTKLRTAVEGENPDAWQALKRLYVQDVTTAALRVTEQGEVANPAGKLVKAFSDPKLRANLRAAMTPDEWQDFNELTAVLRRAGSVPALRSDTAFNQEAMAEDLKRAEPFVAKVIDNVNPVQALKNLREFVTSRNYDKNAGRLVELVTSGDPDAIKAMRELRQISPGTSRGLLLLGHLLSRGGSAAAEEAVLGTNDRPSQ